MDQKKKKRRNRKFKRQLTVYLLVLCVIAGGLLYWLWNSLDRYQTRLDQEAAEKARIEAQLAAEQAEQRAPQLAFEAFLESADADYWTEQWFAAHPGSYDDPALVRERMGEIFSEGNYEAWKASDFTAEHPRYVLKNGSEALAHVDLSGAGLNWSVAAVTVHVDGTHEATVKAPDGYTILCNGKPFDQAPTESEQKLFDMADYADRIVDPISWNTYTVSGQLFEPTLEAVPPEGIPTITDEDGTVFYVLSGEEAADYRERAESFIYALLRYYMMGNQGTYGNMLAVLNHVAANSQARKLINDSYDGVSWDPCNANVSYDAKAADVRMLAANCLLVEVAYHAEGTANGTHNVADGTYRVYFLDTGKGMQIFGLAYQ